MKLSPFLLIALIAFSCQPREVDENDIEVSLDKVYLKSTGELFSGVVAYRFNNSYDSNKVSGRITYANGIQKGKWFTYGFAGEVIQHGEYLDLSVVNSPVPHRVKCERVDLDRWYEGDLEFVDVFFIKPAFTFSDVDIQELAGVFQKAFPAASKNLRIYTQYDSSFQVYPRH